MSRRRLPLVLRIAAAVLPLAGCSDRITAVPAPAPLPPGVRATIACRVEGADRALSCAPAAGGTRGNLLLGGQGVNVRLISTATAYDGAAELLSSSVSVRNLLAQPMGTTTGTDVAGVRVVFASGPTVTSGTGTVSVQNADGTGSFTTASQPYFEYHEILQPQGTSQPKPWRFSVPPSVGSFTFELYVDTPLPDELAPLRWTREAGPLSFDYMVALGGNGETMMAGGQRFALLRRTRDGWARMPAPVPPPGSGSLFAVYVAPDGQALAAGTTQALGFDGNRWRTLPSFGGFILDLAGTSMSDVWAAGTSSLRHWNGTGWDKALPTTASPRAVARDPAANRYLAVGRQRVGFGGCCPQTNAVVIELSPGSAPEYVVDIQYDYNLLDVAAGPDGSAVAVGNLRHDSTSARVGVVLRRDSLQGEWKRVVEADSTFIGVARHRDGSYYVLSETHVYRLDGSDWSLLPNSAHPELEHIYLDADSVLYGVGNNVYRYRGDGWTTELPLPDGYNLGVWVADAGHAFVSGQGRILAREGGGWAVATALRGSWYGISGSGLTDVHAAGLRLDSASALFRAAVARFDGSAWSSAVLPAVVPGYNHHLHSVWVADAEHAFAVGYAYDSTATLTTGLVAMRTPLGWTLAATAADQRLLGVGGTSAKDVWAVGYQLPAAGPPQGLVAHWNGESWVTTVLPDVVVRLYAVWAASPTAVYAAGSEGAVGVVYRYDGSAWTRVYTGERTLQSIWGSGEGDIYAVGTQGAAVHFNGTAWTAVDGGTSADLFGVSGSSGRDFFAVGAGGAILHGVR